MYLQIDKYMKFKAQLPIFWILTKLIQRTSGMYLVCM